MTRQRTRPNRRLVFQLEAREGPCVPATVTFTPDATYQTVTGTSHRDVTSIADNRTDPAGGVVVTANAARLFTSGSTPQVHVVQTIALNTKKGDRDTVTSNLNDNMVSKGRLLLTTFGRGKDARFATNVNGNLLNGTLLLHATGRSAGNRITYNVNATSQGKRILDLSPRGRIAELLLASARFKAQPALLL
jgi:hypothetical protein